MRVGLWRTSTYKDDGVFRIQEAIHRALIELGHEAVVVGAPRPNIAPLMDCDVVIVSEVMWNWGKKTDPETVLKGVRAIGPDRCILGVNCPLESMKGDVRTATHQVIREVPRVWANSRHAVEGIRDDAFVNPFIPHLPRYSGPQAGERGLIATGRLWDKRKRVLLPVEAGYRHGDYTLCGSLGLFGGWVRKGLMSAGAEMLSVEPSSGGKPWKVGWPEEQRGGASWWAVEYTGKYPDYTHAPWDRAKVHFAGVEAGWVGDPGHLEYVTIEAMDAGLNVVAPAHCARPGMGYDSIFTFDGDDPREAIDAAMASPLLDHAHDLSLHDPQMFVRRLLEWSWTPHEYALA